jgi:hypothetical protein
MHSYLEVLRRYRKEGKKPLRTIHLTWVPGKSPLFHLVFQLCGVSRFKGCNTVSLFMEAIEAERDGTSGQKGDYTNKQGLTEQMDQDRHEMG